MRFLGFRVRGIGKKDGQGSRSLAPPSTRDPCTQSGRNPGKGFLIRSPSVSSAKPGSRLSEPIANDFLTLQHPGRKTGDVPSQI